MFRGDDAISSNYCGNHDLTRQRNSMMKSDVRFDHVAANARAIYPEKTANCRSEFVSGLFVHV
jgi:hypothetical protein